MQRSRELFPSSPPRSKIARTLDVVISSISPAARERIKFDFLVKLPLSALEALWQQAVDTGVVTGEYLIGGPPSGRYPSNKFTLSKSGHQGMRHSINNCEIYLHQLSALLHARRNELPINSSLTASHLCQSSKCFQISHVRLETQDTNNSRQRCPKPVNCPNCNTAVVICKHNPRCIQ